MGSNWKDTLIPTKEIKYLNSVLKETFYKKTHVHVYISYVMKSENRNENGNIGEGPGDRLWVT